MRGLLLLRIIRLLARSWVSWTLDEKGLLRYRIARIARQHNLVRALRG